MIKLKKTLMILMILILSVCVLVSCSGDMGNDIENGANNAGDTAKGIVEGAGDTVARSVNGAKNAVERTVDNAGDKMNGNVDTSKFIGEAKAKEIALNKAGLKNEDVEFVKVKLDKDDGIWQYEVEFVQGNTEYDADVKAEDGALLSWDVDSAEQLN